MTIKSLCMRIAPGDDQRVAEGARVDRVSGGPCHLLRRLEVHATGKFYVLDPGHYFGGQEPPAHLANQFSEGLVVCFDVPDAQPYRVDGRLATGELDYLRI